MRHQGSGLLVADDATTDGAPPRHPHGCRSPRLRQFDRFGTTVAGGQMPVGQVPPGQQPVTGHSHFAKFTKVPSFTRTHRHSAFTSAPGPIFSHDSLTWPHSFTTSP